MELINHIFLNKESKEISYFFPIKLKAPFPKRFGKKQELRISGTTQKGKFSNESSVTFTVNIYDAKLSIDPKLVHFSYANESFVCRKIENDSFIKETEFYLRNEITSRTSREKVYFSKLIFEVPTAKLLFYLENKKLPIRLTFPKLEFKTTLKRQAKDYVEYVVLYCAEKPIPERLITAIKNDEKRQLFAFRFYLLSAIVLPLLAIIIIINLPESYEVERSTSELILKCICAWSVGYSFIHFLIVRPLVGKNTSFLFRLVSVFS